MEIEFNGFLKHAIKQYPKEACAFLYSFKPYSSEERWIAWIVENISEDPRHSWIPNKKDVAKLRRWANEMGYVKIGNIHTHCLHGEKVKDMFEPSEIDLKFARKFNDIIRGIVVCDKISIFGVAFHDKFGNDIDIKVEEKSK